MSAASLPASNPPAVRAVRAFLSKYGLIITLVVGVGGTLALLAVFWRPPKPAPAES